MDTWLGAGEGGPYEIGEHGGNLVLARAGVVIFAVPVGIVDLGPGIVDAFRAAAEAHERVKKARRRLALELAGGTRSDAALARWTLSEEREVYEHLLFYTARFGEHLGEPWGRDGSRGRAPAGAGGRISS